MTLQYWVLRDVSLFVTASWTAFLFARLVTLVAPQLNYINVVRLRERHDYADLTSMALYAFSVSKCILINLVHRCIAQQCMTLK